MDIQNMRVVYTQDTLDDLPPGTNPYTLFKDWFTKACSTEVEPNALCLSTCSNNKPSSRIVLLKAFDENGFVFFTNYNSKKSCDLLENPFASMVFWWGQRSVRIEGIVEKVSDIESDLYFKSRPVSSQVGAWVSNQSSVIENRGQLEALQAEYTAKFLDADSIPRPPHWGGFRLKPNSIEFWQGRISRLHDRIKFINAPSNHNLTNAANCVWKIIRLAP